MDIQLTQIIFQIINFGVVFGALVFLLYKPVLKIFDERAKRIEEGQKAAQQAIDAQENLSNMAAEAQKKLKKERASVLEKAQEEAKERAAQIIADAKAQAQEETEKSKKAWEEERRQLIKAARTEMAEAALKAAEVVTAGILKSDKKAQEKLIDAELEKMLKQI
jgi:F-type H+-transporting ATPase subunit b